MPDREKVIHDLEQCLDDSVAAVVPADTVRDAIAIINEMDITIRALMGEFGDSCDVDGCGGGKDA